MSPEQARGQEVDKRADIWAFGVVLYEMLTGEQLFEGATVTDTLAAVLTKEPDWNKAPAQTRRLLQACLEKDPKMRLRDIGDTSRLLEPASRREPHRSRVSWAIAAFAILVAAISLWAWWRAAQPSEKPLVRLDVDLGSDVSLGSRWGAERLSRRMGRAWFLSRTTVCIPGGSIRRKQSN
jgi:serine/threonine-protein kinase